MTDFTHTWNFVDKSTWPRGEWEDEPDKAQWVDKETGLDCLIHRGPMGSLCGYVGVPETHPLFGKSYDDAPGDVHGGLTFANACGPQDAETGRGICHIEEGAANKKVWWFGFDCAHSGDLCPSPRMPRLSHFETYCRISYVKTQTEYLAHQLAAAGE